MVHSLGFAGIMVQIAAGCTKKLRACEILKEGGSEAAGMSNVVRQEFGRKQGSHY
jgi:hypothetical protein